MRVGDVALPVGEDDRPLVLPATPGLWERFEPMRRVAVDDHAGVLAMRQHLHPMADR
jgi:hypothetical protein